MNLLENLNRGTIIKRSSNDFFVVSRIIGNDIYGIPLDERILFSVPKEEKIEYNCMSEISVEKLYIKEKQ